MKEKREVREVKTSFGKVAYAFQYSKVKKISLRIKTNKEIVITAPYGVAPEIGDSFILKKEKYIYNVLASLSIRVVESQRTYVTGEEFYYLGKILTLELVEASKDKVVIKEDKLLLYTKTPEDIKRKKMLVDKWFTVKRKSIYTKINAETCEKFKKYKLPLAQLEIKHMTDKWGTCSPGRGIVTLSTQLIDAPREAIEYVMVHEYAHFIHQNHSKNFHKVVQEIMPEWEEHKTKLELTDFNKSFDQDY